MHHVTDIELFPSGIMQELTAVTQWRHCRMQLTVAPSNN